MNINYFIDLLTCICNEKENIEEKNYEIDKILDINKRFNNNDTLLIFATKNGNVKLCRKLIESGADINIIDNDGMCSLHHFIENRNNNRELCILRMLLDYGANLEVKDSNMNTPLMLSVEKDYYQITELLLNYGANPNNVNINGNTSLHIACLHNNYNLCVLLMKNGANIYMNNGEGLNINQIINNQKNKYDELNNYIRRVIESRQEINMLFKRANIDEYDKDEDDKDEESNENSNNYSDETEEKEYESEDEEYYK